VAYGQGTVSKTKNWQGLWVGRVDLGMAPDGRRLRKMVKAKTKDALAQKMAEVRAKRDRLHGAVD
jgi:hypothetical protein